MFFLLNDAVLNIDSDILAKAAELERNSPVRLDFVGRLGQELYAEQPMLHRDFVERARRLASLIVVKAPAVNAALFLAPKKGCAVEHVNFRYAQVDFNVMCGLHKRQSDGALTTVEADSQVWRRLAA